MAKSKRKTLTTPEQSLPYGFVQSPIDSYSTNAIGAFQCRNRACAKSGLGSKKVGISIRR